MSKNKERDELIQQKLEELTKRKEKLEKNLIDYSKDYKTNLTIKDENDSLLVINLRTVNNVEKLTDEYFSRLIVKADSIREARSLLLGIKCTRDNMIVYGYKFKDWEEDFLKLVNKLKAIEELGKINKAIEQLPEFFTDEKKDDDLFNDILSSVG